MPVGRPDFWYGQVLLFEQIPTDGRTDAGPTSDWAYDHAANASAHHAKYTDSEAVAAMGAKANTNPLHHDRYTNTEADARIALHAANASAHHSKTVSSEIDHGQVQGLGDDDHGQYLKAAGGRPLTGWQPVDDHADWFYGRWDGTTRYVWGAHYAGNQLMRLWTAAAGDFVFVVDGAGNITTVGTVDGVDLSGGLFVDRGDAAAADKTSWTDGAWTDWDLSAIVPAGAKAVLLEVVLNHASAGAFLKFRKNGHTGGYATCGSIVQVSGMTIDVNLVVACDSNRIVEYYTPNTGWSTAEVTVRGWWK